MERPGGSATAPRIRRAYFDCRFGQLHVHNAVPPGGGFDELTTVICLHGAGETGRVFLPRAAGARSPTVLCSRPTCPDAANRIRPRDVDAVTAGAHAVTDFVPRCGSAATTWWRAHGGAKSPSAWRGTGCRASARGPHHRSGSRAAAGWPGRASGGDPAPGDAQMPALGRRLIEALRA